MLYFGFLKQNGQGPCQALVKTARWCLDRYFSPTQTYISGYFDVDSSLFTGLDSVLVCFPQFLLCYSLHSFVQPLDFKEEEKKIRNHPQLVTLHPVHVRWCKIQTRMNIIPEDSKLAQTRTIKQLSQILRIKKNLVALRKRIRRKASTVEDEPKRLLCSVSKQLLYVLNNHQPLQLKINELFEKYSKKKEKETKEDENGRWTTLEEVETNNWEEGMMSEQDHGIGLNQDHRIVSDMQDERGRAYVPSTILLLDKSSTVKNEHPRNTRESSHLAMFDKSTICNGVQWCPPKTNRTWDLFIRKQQILRWKAYAQLLYSKQSGLNCCDQSCVKKTNKYASILSPFSVKNIHVFSWQQSCPKLRCKMYQNLVYVIANWHQ